MRTCQGPEPANLLESRYYCRGCGRVLSPGLRSHFHRECLRFDKRERVREQRRREQERFKRLLEKQRCLNCGAKYGDQPSAVELKTSCEASQGT
jgi:hypothetical protein